MSLRKLKSLLKNESGNFAIIFAITAFPILGAASLAVDYSNMQQERSHIQQSLDAAALATAKELATGTSGEALEAYARDFFEANLPSSIEASRVELEVEVKTTEVTDDQGNTANQKTLFMNANLEYNSFIAQIVGHDQFTLGISSEVAMGNMTVEVALVIDNSGSMGSNGRMTLAKQTATQMIETVHSASSFSNKPDPAKFALVPFAASVNIGSGNAGMNWMDTRGLSPMHHENLDWYNTYYTPNSKRWNGAAFEERIAGVWTAKSRFDIYNVLNTNWAGCVEMRPWPHNTQDTVAFNNSQDGIPATSQTASADDRAKFFVPMFAPSEPGKKKVTSTGGSSSNDYYSYSNDYLGKTSSWTDRADWRKQTGASTVVWTTESQNPGHTGSGTNTVIGVANGQNSRQNWIWRYQAADLDNQIPSLGSSFGPNYSCTTSPITPLTTDKQNALNAVNAMQPSGNTNIQEGVAWGWRALSPQEPFTGGREVGDAENRKYMIVLTDGNNTYGTSSNPNGSSYAAWGYAKHDRIEDGLTNSDLAGTPYQNTSLNTYEKKMNAHTVQTCNNAKADGVTVFTIAFDVPNGSSVKQMLETCSGSGIIDGKPVLTAGNYYYDVNGAEIEDAMASIASQISDMRIMK
ncbi:MAG: pilus assembly protein TadG-related protein [Rhizobiaceae bacterium]